VRDQGGSGQHDLTALVEEDSAANGGSRDERQSSRHHKGIASPMFSGRGSKLVILRIHAFSVFGGLSARTDHGDAA
jgi:hypothetical protein